MQIIYFFKLIRRHTSRDDEKSFILIAKIARQKLSARKGNNLL